MTDLTIPRVTVLTGHTDPETAYLVDDYPYGYRLRCQIRYWIETGTKGTRKGQQRFVSQTTNPKRPGIVWNAPKPSTYSSITVMYLDSESHVQPFYIPFWVEGATDTRVRAMGIYEALTDEQRSRYDACYKLSYKVNPTTWAEWSATISGLADYMAETGEAPTLEGQIWKYKDRPYYLTDPAAYVTAARNELANR